MKTDLTTYPETKKGAVEIIAALTPSIVRLWKVEREHLKTDDLVVLINTDTGRVSIEPRAAIYKKMKKLTPDYDLTDSIINPVPAANGTVAIWGIIGFASGRTCLVRIVLGMS